MGKAIEDSAEGKVEKFSSFVKMMEGLKYTERYEHTVGDPRYQEGFSELELEREIDWFDGISTKGVQDYLADIEGFEVTDRFRRALSETKGSAKRQKAAHFFRAPVGGRLSLGVILLELKDVDQWRLLFFNVSGKYDLAPMLITHRESESVSFGPIFSSSSTRTWIEERRRALTTADWNTLEMMMIGRAVQELGQAERAMACRVAEGVKDEQGRTVACLR